MDVYRFAAGEGPLLVSNPHSGTFIPDDIAARMTDAGRATPDTDWHVDKLYGFLAELNIPVLTATHSRYVIDLNRAPDDRSLYPGQFTVGLLPEVTFDKQAIYQAGQGIAEEEKQQRIDVYWRPYHDRLRQELDAIKARHGYALLWDAHSIKPEVPSLFAGRLPDLNFGTNGGESCGLDVKAAIAPILKEYPDYTSVFDGRFKGGYITRHYGRPDDGIHAIQLELSQAAYMNAAQNRYGEEKAFKTTLFLRKLVLAFQALKPAGG